MRRYVVPILAILLASSLTAGAGSSGTRDPVGDENGWNEGIAVECHAPAIDITGVLVTSADGLVTVKLHVLDYEDLSMTCEDAMGTTTMALPGMDYHVQLEPAWSCDVVCTAGDGPAMYFSATRSGDEAARACASVRVENGAASRCMGDFHTEGNVLVWTLPTAGTFGQAGLRYDVSGESFEVAARSAYGDAVFTNFLFDYAYPPTFTV